MSVSVVMVSYHTGPALWISIHSVLRQEGLQELIVVDNGNPPHVLKKLQAWAADYSALKIISGHGNVGFAKGCNLGAAAATGDYLLLLNPDCKLPEKALLTMAEALDVSGAALAGCHLQNPDGSEQRGGRRDIMTPKNALVESFSLHRFLPMERVNYHEQPMPDQAHEVPAISGAFMFMKLAEYKKLGGMDEGYFLHMEDMDFCLRVARSGGGIICVPQVKVLHFRSTSEASSAKVEWHKTKGFVRYFFRHFRKAYMPGFLYLVAAGVWARFMLKSFLSLLPRGRDNSLKRLLLLYRYEIGVQSTALKGLKITVTGASGQLGLCVIGQLLAAGAEVIAVSRRADISYRHPRLIWHRADLTGSFSVPDSDALVHTAPLWLLPSALQRFGGIKKLIAFGSTSVFGKAASQNAYERQVVMQLYNAEAALQVMCRTTGVDWALLRPTLIYGAGMDGNVTRVARTIKRLGLFPLYPPAAGLREPVHVFDLAESVVALLDKQSQGKAYNVAGRERIPYRQMVERVFDAVGRAPRLMFLSSLPVMLDVLGLATLRPWLNGEIARRMNEDLVFGYEDAAADFGFRPRGFLENGAEDLGA